MSSMNVSEDIFADPSLYNFTKESWNDFLEKMKDHMLKTSNLSKTTTNISKVPANTSDNCLELCGGFMREILTDYRHDYHGIITLGICVFGTIANILNIIVLTRKEMSKTPINLILKWLAVCDMFVMIEYIPFSWHMYFVMKGVPDFGYTWTTYILFHMHFTQVLHTISISLTVSLAVWRYIAIKINFWVHSVIIKLLPCCILTIISFVLIDVLCRANKRKLKLKGYNKAGTNGHRSSRIDRRTDRTTMLLVAVLLLFLITEFPQGILGLLSGILGKCFFLSCYSLFGETMDLLALINAAIGFVLYGSMSKQFRVTFKSLFFKKRQQKIEMTRITNINTTNV